MDKESTTIFAEQYLECSANDEGSWDVYLVVENVTKKPTIKPKRLKYFLGNFQTMAEGDLYAESMRYYYDKSVYKFEYF
jgi:hypothetical protein|tara:strand:- start:99 stop:335 length:237 start_codon:yes stop_codon:yes gene_type:complete